jgi:hypothetical protein
MNDRPDATMTRSLPKSVLLGALLACTPPPVAAAQEASEVLARKLIEVRGQVDELQNELNLKREEHKNRMAF